MLPTPSVLPVLAALTVTVGVGPADAALAAARAAARAPADLPDLAVPANGCVGASPTVAAEPSWAFQRLAPPVVWTLTRGDSVVVAVLDTGVSATAPALAGAVRPGVDVVRGGRADLDCRGRGTALAGLVAARPQRGSAMVGIAPGATILPVRIVDEQGRVPDGALAAGLRAATQAGAKVILVGTGTTHPDAALRAAVREAVAADVVVVAPVAGEASDRSTKAGDVWYPAAFPEVIAVGGSGPDGTVSGSPPAEAGVDVAAPSEGVVSIGPVGRGHFRVGGTAVAAAQVAAVTALVRGYRRDDHVGAVTDRIVRTAEPPVDPALARFVGAGMVDVREAVAATVVGTAVLDPLPADAETPPAAPPRSPAASIAVGASAIGLAAAALAAAILATIRSGRRRGWQR
ncbi:S8 family serine peptidase [Micromonospora sp. NPDC093277]|uniref:S8 family serine peptidase n=1 Tax=Micromonospora sp. NPDC093277 TaxID=3364291 RepID=UPI003820D49A